MKEVKKTSQADTKLSRLAKDFCLKGGVLYKINKIPEGRENYKMKPAILGECHDNLLIGGSQVWHEPWTR
ncbi:hypothetical protein PR048_015417 [Dryococelus australis]|uniref:Uncharacterized protein n=1 Tax=Dryococelus australis TaxID=614101 RepID=A0ABQ9HGX3_9NEOP|nr:hypothetical protein PR048_015417 [Dryococelus australis]